eukprot:973639-Prorocentrum_lima.AAC.1
MGSQRGGALLVMRRGHDVFYFHDRQLAEWELAVAREAGAMGGPEGVETDRLAAHERVKRATG